MSMNLILEARKDGADSQYFDLIQTPTDVTNWAVCKNDRLEAYTDWVYDTAEDFVFVKHHIEDMEKWIKRKKEEGFNVFVEVI